MNLCLHHKEACNEALKNHGLWVLVETRNEFDPRTALYGNVPNLTMRVIQENLCPLCEFEAHVDGFDSDLQIDALASNMAKWARSQRLIPKLQ